MEPRAAAALARIGLQPGDIAGARAQIEVPLTDTALTRLINAELGKRDTPVAAIRVTALEGGAMDVQVVPKMRLLPAIHVLVQIERQPRWPDDAVLGLRWTMPRLGGLASFAAPFLSHLKSLPRGIRVDGDRVAVDLRQLAEDRGAADALQHVAGVRVGSRPGVVVAELQLMA